MGKIIETVTKPNGAWNTWVEVGQWQETKDAFGDVERKWVASAQGRYPQQDKRLQVKREYAGRGASQRITWKIIVPDGYPLIIRVCTGDARSEDREETLYDPNPAVEQEAAPMRMLPSAAELLAQIVAAYDEQCDLTFLIEQARAVVAQVKREGAAK